jgi:CBS domain-containing protein
MRENPRTVADLMQRQLITVEPETSLADLERTFIHARVGAMPVVEHDGRLVGIVSRSDVVRQLALERSLGEAVADAYRDQTDETFAEKSRDEIAEAIGQRMERLRVRDVMILDVVAATPGMPLAEAARRMLERKVHRLPVLEDGRLVGIVSSLDFVRVVADAAEA